MRAWSKRRLEARLGDPDRERADPDPALVEHAHHHVEAAALGAEQRVRRQRHLVEGRARRPGEARWPILCSLAPTREARAVAVDQEDAHAAVAGGLVGAGEHHREVADRRVVDPELAAGQAPAGAGALRGGLDAGEVGARLGLGERIGRPALGAQQRGEVAGALGGAAVLVEQRRDQLDQAALVGDRGVAARELLHHDRIGQRVHAGAALSGRDADAEQAELRHLGVDLGRKALVLIERARGRPHHVVGEPPHHVLDLSVLGRQRHAWSPLERCPRPLWQAVRRLSASGRARRGGVAEGSS